MIMRGSLLAYAAAVVSFSGAADTFRFVDLDEHMAKYVAATNKAARELAAWDAEQRAWRTACGEAKKAGKELPPAPAASRPPHPNSIRSPFFYPTAEIRADEQVVAEKATLAERQKAWDEADPKTRAKWRPAPPRRVVNVESGDAPGLTGMNVGGTGACRRGFPVGFAKAGRYYFWIRHWQDEDAYNALEFLLRSPEGECVNYQLVDRPEELWTDTHAEGRTFKADGRKRGWAWTKVEADVEYPGDYELFIGRNVRYFQKGMAVKTSRFAVSDGWATNDPKADPRKAPLAESRGDVEPAPPEGFVRATHHAQHVSFNSSIANPQKRPPTNLMECYSWFYDPVRYLKYGVTDSNFDDPKLAGGGVSFHVNADAAGTVNGILSKKYPFDPGKAVSPSNAPIGRAAGSDGRYSRDFSFAFQEYNDLYQEENKKLVKRILEEKPNIDDMYAWWTAWEQCGSYDYGETSVAEWRKWLERRYGTLEALNKAWHMEYASFGDIFPEYWWHIFGKEAYQDDLARRRAMANFIDFRAFCSECYATRIAQKTRAALALDPKRRHVTSNLSCNNISSVMWMQWRPLIFEDTAQITMAGSDTIGYDNYGTDDLYGANYELFDCFGDGKLRPIVREGAIHAASPELQARSQWHNIAKGMQGMSCFCVQEANVGELSKFGMTDMFHGAAPRPKIAAFADNFRAIHQLEYVISEAKRTRAVRPVAIYYSAICNVMMEKPYASIFDCGPDNFFRVYELLHANGYDVTFVTDRQIREGGDWLKSLGAIVFVDATYIPLDVQEKVFDWVKNGGAILADAQSGSCDGHAFPTDVFTKFLGVRPVQQKKVDDMAAEKLAFGYSAYSFDVINRDELYKTACEVKDAPGGTHPISRRLDKTMFSALGYNEIRLEKGTQVLQENNGRPYMVVRDEGKGKVAYFAGYLGTMFGAGCTKYEWADAHADDSPYRVLDAWAEWAGLEKAAVSDLPKQMSYGMRFESPLVDGAGNAMMGVVSQLRCDVPSFRVKYRMPANFKAPKMVLGSVNSTRRLVKLPFAWDAKTRMLTVRMCGFRCWGNILALNDVGPFVSVEAADAKRDAYSLAWFRPSDEVEYKVRVFNPCDDALVGGEVELRLPAGWFCDREKAAVAKIPAYGESDELSFRVKAPAFNSCRKIEPINFIYRGKRSGMISDKPVVSSPAAEMVWFQVEPHGPHAESFVVE